MSDEHMDQSGKTYADPSGNTERFRAFANQPEAAGPAASRTPLVVGVAVVVVLVLAVVAWLALG